MSRKTLNPEGWPLMSMAALVVLSVSCAGSRHHAGAANTLPELVRHVESARLSCSPQARRPAAADLIGCLRTTGDSLFYLYRDRSNTVVAAGLLTERDSAASRTALETIAATLGGPIDSTLIRCPEVQTHLWRVRDVRWSAERWQYSLRERTPLNQEGTRPAMQYSVERDRVGCEGHLRIPDGPHTGRR